VRFVVLIDLFPFHLRASQWRPVAALGLCDFFPELGVLFAGRGLFSLPPEQKETRTK
jgi:hypothetical protein